MTVVSAYDMLALPFRQHVQTRHNKTMRFRTKNEHDADHRLHDDVLDHVHSEPRGEDEEEGEEQTAVEGD